MSVEEGVRYEFSGLTRIEALRLKDVPGVEVREDSLPPGVYGEPTTLTIVVTVAALSAVAAYLLRKHDEQYFEEEVTVHHPDGRTERRRVRWQSSKTEAPHDSVIKAIQGR